MDQNAKRKIAQITSLIRKEQFKEALDQLQVIVYKYPKMYQFPLMAGLCYTKIDKLDFAERSFLEALDLKQNQPNAIKNLYQLYSKKNDKEKSIKYLEMSVNILKNGDNSKYRQTLVKLVQQYQKDENLQKIYPIFKHYVQQQQNIGEDFVKIAQSYFKIGVTNRCFNLQDFNDMGMKNGLPRNIIQSARQELNILLIEVINYLYAASSEHHLTQQILANSILEMKFYFPESYSVLMLMLFDEFTVGQLNYSQFILPQIYKLLAAYYSSADNGYLNIKYTSPEIFSVCMVLSYEYLTFFKQFFTLDEIFDKYFKQLAVTHQQIMKSTVIRPEYQNKIKNFILTQCRVLATKSKYQNIQYRLQQLKIRIIKLNNSFLEEVIAKIAINCFTNYDKINQMKNILKIRINNLAQDVSMPHLYKYYYDYIIKIAKIFKSLDEQISIERILNYVTKQDPKDMKFYVQKIWYEWCMKIKKDIDEEQRNKISRVAIEKIDQIYSKLDQNLKSSTLRKKIIIKVYLKDYQIEPQLKEALSKQISFQNLQCIGFYYFYQNRLQESLSYLKEAFKLNQLHYHTNRLIFIALYKLGQQKQGINFLQRIREGFTSVFWINYIIGISKINQKRFIQAQTYLNSAFESFNAGASDLFKFSYEKVYDAHPFSFLLMIQQNQYNIFYDELIFSEQFVYSQLQILSRHYFKIEPSRNKMNLCVKLGELLKILGRTKTSLNYLQEAYQQSKKIEVGQNFDSRLLIQICLMKKQYATLLFYMRQFKQSEFVLYQSYKDVQNLLLKRQSCQGKVGNLIQKMDNQIKALSFQISVERLSMMMKFQSYEYITEYINIFKNKIEYPTKPSLNFHKNKYQFHILEYMHFKQADHQFLNSINQFLSYFKLSITNIKKQSFWNQICQLNPDQRQAVKECLEDYYIINYIFSNGKIDGEQVLLMLQMFPKSTTFYIIYGMNTTDIKHKTASFLKCIQLDKESSISIDILASLYLKQKNYLAACKLFLKSLQVNILNIKCYLGLTISLFCLIHRAIEIELPEQTEIIRKCMIRINSYMQYIRLIDPSENYHLLKFLKLLVSDQKISNFEIKTILQSSQRACVKYKDTLISQLLDESMKEWKNYNIWKNEDHSQIVANYLEKSLKFEEKQYGLISSKIISNCVLVLNEIKKYPTQIAREIVIKQVRKLLNEASIALNLNLKDIKSDQNSLNQILDFCFLIQLYIREQKLNNCEVIELQLKVKEYLYDYIFKDSLHQNNLNKLENVFPNINYYGYITKYHSKIINLKLYLAKSLLKNPANQQLRKIHSAYLITIKCIPLRKNKMTYKLEEINKLNQDMTNEKKTYKKLALLYHDQNAILLFISMSWKETGQRQPSNLNQWVKLLIKIEENNQAQKQLREKARRLKLQILGYYYLIDQVSAIKIINCLPSQDQKQIELIKIISQILHLKDISQVPKSINKLSRAIKTSKTSQFGWWTIFGVYSWAVMRFETCSKIQNLLDILLKDCQHNNQIGAVLLLKFIALLNRQINDQQSMADQIISLTQLIEQCQNKISPNTLVILNCAKHLLSSSYEQIQQQLTIAAQENKVVCYSDILFINSYQVIKLYKNVEKNPNADGGIESFLYYADYMTSIARSPYLKGFFLSLKALVNSLITQNNTGLDINIKKSLLYSPSSAKVLIGL